MSANRVRGYPRLQPDGTVLILVRAEGPALDIIGDAQWEVRPGESVAGHRYDEWVRAAVAGRGLVLR
jgi:hypothetical protein